VFCPLGSEKPQSVYVGYYSVDYTSTIGVMNTTRSAERKCEPGSFCMNGGRFLCDRGHWGGVYGLTAGNCSGLCRPGYYCPLGSASSEEVQCGDSNRYCPTGSFAPLPVALGYYSIGDINSIESTRSTVVLAPVGFYALAGVLYRCPAGYYGVSEGMSVQYCSGPCYAGTYVCLFTIKVCSHVSLIYI
jgi:hypothetical protein